ncbi:MAG TPA: hypothetical protein VD884_20130 [Ohtaekwangia sp.]|nr:hypothetical protein [Ohtaekwangia sp.]
MRRLKKHAKGFNWWSGLLLATSLILAAALPSSGHVYIIIYATLNGKTGHAGLAIDNYNIIEKNETQDTVKLNTLTYYDLWPGKDGFGLFEFNKDHHPVFYTLPNAIWSSPITVNSLYDQGIPHREYYPSDAILMLRTTPTADYDLREYIEHIIETKTIFNPRFYNCSDFVLDGINYVTGLQLKAKEFIPFSFTTTPNKLCRRLVAFKNIDIIKSPPQKITRSFFRERVLKRKHRNQTTLLSQAY